MNIRIKLKVKRNVLKQVVYESQAQRIYLSTFQNKARVLKFLGALPINCFPFDRLEFPQILDVPRCKNL